MQFRSVFSIVSFLALAGAATLATESQRRACEKLEVEFTRVRSLTQSDHAQSEASAIDARWKTPLAHLDARLEYIAPAEDGVGAPWMWAPEHRDELVSLVALVRPTLEQLVALSRQNDGRALVHSCPRLMQSRHRANLLCAAAVAEDGAETAVQWLCAALEVATLEDDGSAWTGSMHRIAADIVVDAARCLSKRPGFDRDLLTCVLGPRLAEFDDAHSWALRVAHDALSIADPDLHRTCSAEAVESLRRALVELEPLLADREATPLARSALDSIEWPLVLYVSALHPGHFRTLDLAQRL